MSIINIKVGELTIAKDNDIIKTVGIGSCVVVCVYDYERKIGGMMHSMLPKRENLQQKYSKKREVLKSKAIYTDESVVSLVNSVIKKGGQKKKLEAKLIGGANLLGIFRKNKESIGNRNIESARSKLRELNIPILKEAVGDNVGRMAEMNLANGIVSVSISM